LRLSSPSQRPAFPPLQTARRETEIDRATETDKGHGRIEKRSIEVTSSLAEYLKSDWPGCAQVFRLSRERKIGEKVETEVILGIASLSREQAGPKRLLGLIRAHWGIENGLHGVRDGTLREDASRIRKGAGPEVMAALRNIVIFLFHRLGHKSAAAATRHYVCQPCESLKILSFPI
jgi:predicted transposase YbfD/YdcC